MEIGTSSQSSAPKTIRSHVSRSVAARYSSFSSRAEVVGAVGVGEDAADVVLDARARVDARGQRLGQAQHDVHGRQLVELPAELAQRAGRAGAAATALGGELAEVGAQQRAEVDVRERRRHLLVDDAHHLLGRDAVGAIAATNEPALVPT